MASPAFAVGRSPTAIRLLSPSRHHYFAQVALAQRCLALPTKQRLQRRSYATPSGPPPKGFRLPPPRRWDEKKESTIDALGKYFLLTEIARGMYVVLEQFFRPPYV
jgi:NADH dehydrogenase (ubiquinone) Fe-S protein 8